jgi:hypothetical protein
VGFPLFIPGINVDRSLTQVFTRLLTTAVDKLLMGMETLDLQLVSTSYTTRVVTLTSDITGWCYEGPHTSDRLEARYREDVAEGDDKLEDCAKRHCGEEVKPKRRPKRSRGTAKLDSDAEEERSAMDLADLKPRAKHTRRASDIEARSKSRSRMQAAQTDTEMDDPKPKPTPAKAKAPATKTKEYTPTNVVENGKASEKSREDSGPAQEKATTTATNLVLRPRQRPTKARPTPVEIPVFVPPPPPKTRPATKKRKLNAD